MAEQRHIFTVRGIKSQEDVEGFLSILAEKRAEVAEKDQEAALEEIRQEVRWGGRVTKGGGSEKTATWETTSDQEARLVREHLYAENFDHDVKSKRKQGPSLLKTVTKTVIIIHAVLVVVFGVVCLLALWPRSQTVSDFAEQWNAMVRSGDVEAYDEACSEEFKNDADGYFYQRIRALVGQKSTAKLLIDVDETDTETTRFDDTHCEIKLVPFKRESGWTYRYVLSIEKQNGSWKVTSIPTTNASPTEIEPTEEEVQDEKEGQEEKQAVEPEIEEKPKFQRLEIKPRAEEAPAGAKMKRLEIKPKER